MQVSRDVSPLDERQQNLVYLVGVGPEHAMWGSVDLDVVRLGEGGVERAAGGVDWQDVVGGAVHDEGRLSAGPDRGNIVGKVLDPGGDHGVGGDWCAKGCRVPVRRDDLLTDPRAQVLVEVVKVPQEVREPGKPVGSSRGDDIVELLFRNPLTQHPRFERTEEGVLRDTVGTVRRGIAGQLTGAHRESDQDHVVEVERVEHDVEIGGAASCISRTTSSISPEQATRTFGGSSLSIRSPGAV